MGMVFDESFYNLGNSNRTLLPNDYETLRFCTCLKLQGVKGKGLSTNVGRETKHFFFKLKIKLTFSA